MENNILTLYILELDSFVIKSAILCPFVQKIYKNKQSCIRDCHGSRDAAK